MCAFIYIEWYPLDNITPIRFVVILTVSGCSYPIPVPRNPSFKAQNCQLGIQASKICGNRGVKG